jgi:hypothetical protein
MTITRIAYKMKVSRYHGKILYGTLWCAWQNDITAYLESKATYL